MLKTHLYLMPHTLPALILKQAGRSTIIRFIRFNATTEIRVDELIMKFISTNSGILLQCTLAYLVSWETCKEMSNKEFWEKVMIHTFFQVSRSVPVRSSEQPQNFSAIT